MKFENLEAYITEFRPIRSKYLHKTNELGDRSIGYRLKTRGHFLKKKKKEKETYFIHITEHGSGGGRFEPVFNYWKRPTPNRWT